MILLFFNHFILFIYFNNIQNQTHNNCIFGFTMDFQNSNEIPIFMFLVSHRGIDAEARIDLVSFGCFPSKSFVCFRALYVMADVFFLLLLLMVWHSRIIILRSHSLRMVKLFETVLVLWCFKHKPYILYK